MYTHTPLCLPATFWEATKRRQGVSAWEGVETSVLSSCRPSQCRDCKRKKLCATRKKKGEETLLLSFSYFSRWAHARCNSIFFNKLLGGPLPSSLPTLRSPSLLLIVNATYYFGPSIRLLTAGDVFPRIAMPTCLDNGQDDVARDLCGS